MSGGGDEDAWLYGEEDSQPAPPPGEGEGEEGGKGVKQEKAGEPIASTNGEAGGGGEEEGGGDKDRDGGEAEEQENIPPVPEGDEDDDSDDDIEITIDKDKIEAAKTSYQNMQMKKAGHEFAKEKKGKFAVEEFDQVGTINGESAVEFDMEALEEKPWRKPGADITDYFNYGFTEDTWTAYCNRQKSLRGNEAGVPVLPSAPILTSGKTTSSTPQSLSSIPILGGGELAAKIKPKISSTLKQVEAKPQEPSGITVMTHEKRIYSNKVLSNMDFSVPPPGAGFSVPPPAVLGSDPPPTGTSVPPPSSSAAPPPVEAFGSGEFPASEFPPAEAFGEGTYSGGFNEPTAEAQWNLPPPTYNTSLPPPSIAPPPGHMDSYSGDSRYRVRDSRDRDREDRYRDYDRDRRSSRRRSRSRERDRRDRDRDRYSDRDRVRVKRERRSRSRSRSPRSHKKSRSDRDRRRDSPDKDEQIKIKEEPEDSAPVAPPGEN